MEAYSSHRLINRGTYSTLCLRSSNPAAIREGRYEAAVVTNGEPQKAPSLLVVKGCVKYVKTDQFHNVPQQLRCHFFVK